MPWDINSLKEYVDQRLVDKDALYTNRFVSQEEAVKTAVAAQDKRLEGMNEIKAMAAQQALTYLPISTYNAEHKSVEDRLGKVEQLQASSQAAIVGKMNQLLVAILGAAVTVALTFYFTHSFVPTPTK